MHVLYNAILVSYYLFNMNEGQDILLRDCTRPMSARSECNCIDIDYLFLFLMYIHYLLILLKFLKTFKAMKFINQVYTLYSVSIFLEENISLKLIYLYTFK